jgi:predicted acylesterase/phospholipase RssA
MPEPAPPQVFISYSHDSDEHRDRVLDLADRLRADGVDAMIDQYVQSPPEGWPSWCRAEIESAQFVLMVCTEIYLRRIDRKEESGVGYGVLWEGRLINQYLYDAGSVSAKLVPVLLADGSPEHVPSQVKGGTIYRVESDQGYEDLYRLLTDQPRVRKSELGILRRLPERPRQSLGEPPVRRALDVPANPDTPEPHPPVEDSVVRRRAERDGPKFVEGVRSEDRHEPKRAGRTVDVQIAFQGGGARLGDFLAAAEVLQAEERAGRICVRRVAGTSAGAIAAAILACGGESAKDVRAHLQLAGSRLAQIVSGTAAGEINLKSPLNAINVWRGKPLLNINGLRKVLSEVLEVALNSGRKASVQHKIDPRLRAPSLTFDDIARMSGKSLFVIAADLIEQHGVIYPERSHIIDALVNSCAIPFAFRGHRELVANPHVDGGLCEYLSSDVLLAGVQQFGEVLAISFAQESDGRAPESAASYIQALISTAIRGSVARSTERLAPGAVLFLQSSHSTFDFAKAFTYPREDQGAVVQLKTQEWIRRWARQNPGSASSSVILEQAMSDMFQWYNACRAREPRRSLKSALIATANCCKAVSLEDAEPDGIVKEYSFAPQRVAMTMFYVAVGRAFPTSGVRIDVRTPDNQKVAHRRMLALDRKEIECGAGYVLLFDEPLMPLTDNEITEGKSYRVRVSYILPGALAGLLGPSRHDFITFSNGRSENYERVDVILRTPPSIRIRSHAQWSDEDKKGLGEELAGRELEFYDSFDPSMVSVGWRVRDFPPGRVLRIDLYKEE